jgi:putative holliday junction resolvase
MTGQAHTPQTILGFDFGTARIGVAVGNTLTANAQPLQVIRVRPQSGQGRAQQLDAAHALLQEWQASCFVVGCPRHANGEVHETAQQAMKFARQLSARSGKTAHFVDETLSSAAVGEQRGRDGSDDAQAAAIILQQYFHEIGR